MDVTSSVAKIEDERNYLLNQADQDQRVMSLQALEIASLHQRIKSMNESHHKKLQSLRSRLSTAEEKASALSAVIESIGRLSVEGINKARGEFVQIDQQANDELAAAKPEDVQRLEQTGVFNLAKSIARS